MIRVWHAVWGSIDEDQPSLYLWGETQQSEKDLPGEHHPFACSIEALAKDLEEVEAEGDAEQEIEILLPTTSTGPTPSPRLAKAAEIEVREEPELQSWKVPSLLFEPVSALAFLTSLPESLPRGLKLGESLLYWIEATKLLLDLLTRGKVIPVLSRKESEFFSQWQIISSEANDAERWEALVRAMPAACRSLSTTSSSQADARATFESFMSKGCDDLVRVFLMRHQFLDEEEDIAPRQVTAASFLNSLNKADSRVDGPVRELMQLEENLRKWSGPLLPSLKHFPLRTAFRLITPDSPDGQWIVEFLLQEKSNPSHVLSVADLWQGNRGFLKNSEQTFEDLEEHLLRDLGKASSVFPKISEALDEPYPTHIKLSTTEAYEFLKKLRILLEKANFGVILPSWWSKPSVQFGLHLHVESGEEMSSPSRQGFLGMNQLLNFSWQIALGEEKLSIEDFRKLVEKKSPLVNIDGQWVELQPTKLEATFAFLEKQAEKPSMRLIEALRFGMGAAGGDNIFPVVGFSSGGWVERFVSAEAYSISVEKELDQFKGQLRSYQLEGLSWLHFLSQLGIGGCLADDMGLGKTIQLLALLHLENKHLPEKPEPTLLVVPMSILDNWYREAGRFTPELRIYMHHGPTRLSGRSFYEEIEKCHVVLTTYNLAYRDEELFSAVRWGRVALDEAQNIKNLATKQTQSIRKLVYDQLVREDGGICQRIALTGTPLENHLDELWSIFDFLNPGFLGSIEEFRSRFAVPIERYRDDAAAEKLSRLVQPFILRRLKTDPTVVTDLPEKIEMEVVTSLTNEQTALYQSVVEQMLPQVESSSGMHRKGLVLATITKLKQICDHPALYLKDGSKLDNRSGKLNRLEQLLEVILAEGDKVLLFTQYAQMGRMLKHHLQERYDQEVLFLHGGQNKNTRDNMIGKFQKDDGPPLFILSLKAGGFGLNLTQANQVIHFDQWWNPAVQDQATDRAHRIGQKRSVQVRNFLCKGTLEEKIATMLTSKKSLADSIVRSTKSTITEMSTDELRDLLSLAHSDSPSIELHE